MANQQTELKLLKYIEQDCTLSAEQLASLCGMTPEDVKTEIKKLEDRREGVLAEQKAAEAKLIDLKVKKADLV